MTDFKTLMLLDFEKIDGSVCNKAYKCSGKKVVDPTLLLTSSDYDKIAKERLEQDKYLLLYARRYNPKWKRMQKNCNRKWLEDCRNQLARNKCRKA